MERRHVKPCQPHVANDDELQWVAEILEASRQCSASGFVADVWLPVWWIGGRASHHDFDDPLVVVIVMPERSESHDRLVEIDTDPATHADDEPLAVDAVQAAFEVIDKILGDEADSLLGADKRFEPRPPALQLLLPGDLFSFGNLLELWVNPRPLGFRKLYLRQAT